ncbi:hypothetical protein EV210_12312 [Anaerospora hongkongensis]|uniref:Uncharacterized protein n=1 Tax=Anaerospora hongkongensis TaxID=244830 RepID=A0A4R1PQZ8_9FIRM|nr:hypothetical protein [Anaerospora hongkongensis]TCL32192.1 hypothetical protein EV210_12312 [Anaerospora hongkongensis]
MSKEEKEVKKRLKIAASYIKKGNKFKKWADNEKYEEKAKEYKKRAKNEYEMAKAKIATTKVAKNMTYGEAEVYDILKKAVEKEKEGDDKAVEKAAKKIIEAEK